MTNTMMNFPLTLAPMLRRAVTLFPNVEVVSRMPDGSTRRHTYREINTRAHRLARGLLEVGLRQGERVATLMWNHGAHLESYFGIPLAGGVTHTLNLRLPPQQLGYIAQHAEDRFLIVDDVLLPILQSFLADAPFERIFVHRTCGNISHQFDDFEHLIRNAPDDLPLPELSEYDGAAMCYTSGTTGDPKGVIYSHRAIALHSMMVTAADSIALSQNDTVLALAPMFHANSWGIPFAATMVGAKQVLPGPKVDAESVLELCESEQITFAYAVPTVWMAVCEALEHSPHRWKLASGLRVLIAGSAPSESLLRRLHAHGIHPFQGWGLTETTPLATMSLIPDRLADLSIDEKYSLRCAQGTAVPYVEARVMNDAGEVPPDGKTMGEVQVRGPWIAASYFKMPTLGDKWTEDGWFRTGDVVTINEHGYIRIVDRTKDLIKSGGEWISSVDLENALLAHPAIKEAAVIAIPHAKWLERPLAVMVTHDDIRPTPEELNAMLLSKFAKWQLPDAYIFVDELPHTSTGKLLKSALRAQFSQPRAEARLQKAEVGH
ncbi:MAG TPA: long-chain fatty acid--CoA ligase [Terriglobales bacterium]|nr:long-chain fatty acid--CoA ligase [Terriglobales bacterium]